MLQLFFRISLIAIFYINHNYAYENNYPDYPLSYIVESCQITKERANKDSFEKEKILENRKKYNICMNFIISLSTTLNRRCMFSQ